jgi:hypothetical protein
MTNSPNELIIIFLAIFLFYGIWRSHSGGYEKFNLLGYNSCSPLKGKRRFGRTCRLHFQGRRISQSRSQRCYLPHIDFLLGLFFVPENGGVMFLQNFGWLSTGYTALYPRIHNSLFWAYFPHFKKIKRGLWDHPSVGPPQIFRFLCRPFSYQRKVGN